MIEVRIHGRGGQGAVIASKLLASAIFQAGKFVQCFPDIGVERRGAPVVAFLRVDDSFINLRTNITAPHHIIVLDERLMVVTKVSEGLQPGGSILINSKKPPQAFTGLEAYTIYTVDANQIATENHLGSSTAPIVNTCMAGAFLRVSQLASIEGLHAAIQDEVPVKQEQNMVAASQAFERVGAYILNKEDRGDV